MSRGRLTVVDEMFLRTHLGLGTPIAMQGLWRFADRIDRESLAVVHERLAHGSLGRRVRRSPIPGARPRWTVAAESYPLVWSDREHDVLTWADSQASNLDPTLGPGWFLSATHTPGGGSAVSIVCSHVLTDARGLIIAADRALTDTPQAQCDGVAESDIADAARTWSKIAKKLRPRSLPHRASHPHRHESSAGSSSAILDVVAADWDRAAAAAGATANSLFVGVVAGIVRRSGALPAHSPIDVSIPIDIRTTSEVGNAMTMTEVIVEPHDTLADIRASSRAAYSQPMAAPSGIPAELLQVVPQRVAHSMSRGSGERDVLCSNIGTVPRSFDALGDHRATGVATRAVHPGLTSQQLSRLRTRLSGYLCRNAEHYTLALVGLDPRHIGSSDELADLAERELRRWGLATKRW